MKPPPIKPGHALLERLLDNYPEDDLPLDLGACAIALPHRPSLRIETVQSELDRLASESVLKSSDPADFQATLDSVRRTLFEKHGFNGNEEDYYAPENSFLDAVLTTKKGIPITLSVIFIEVARRVGVPMFGMALPCHFVVGCFQGEKLRVFDPFHGGIERTVEESIELVHLLSGGSVTIGREHFRPTPPSTILTRMLMNLRGIYQSRNLADKLIPVLEQILILNPNESSLHGELALNLATRGDLSGAHDHLKTYIDMVGGLSKEEMASEWVQRIRTKFSAYN